MPAHGFSLPLPEDEAGRRLARHWLLMALLSLVVPGVLVILILLARTPVVHAWVPWVGSFKTALVIHVDLLVLVWFLAFAGLLADLNATPSSRGVARMGWGGAALGASLMALSPLLAPGTPRLNNYVPVLENAPFFAGLGLFILGMTVTSINALVNRRPFAGLHTGLGGVQIGIITGLGTLLLAVAIGGVSWYAIPEAYQEEKYYELLFWGGGHLLQFTHTQLMLVVWLWLATAAGVWPDPARTPYRLLAMLLLIGGTPALLGVVIQGRFALDSLEYREAFTDLMWWAGGLAPLPIGAYLLFGLWQTRRARTTPIPEATCLVASIWLFGVGGVIGYRIVGTNVTIPAHYHGSIVAVTLAYMGLTYHLLPRLGQRPIAPHLASRQALMLVTGQTLHSLGLAWSGVYNVQRKVSGAEQLLQTPWEKIAMALMSLGGMLAVAGGLWFLVLTLRNPFAHPGPKP